MHADYRSRESLALDLMEPVRPHLDRYVLDLLRSRTYRSTDFFETRRGGSRLLPPVTRQLAEEVAHLLAQAPGSRIDRRPTPLTSSNRKTAGATIRPRKPVAVATSAQPPKTPRVCKRCGNPVPSCDRVYCDQCLPHYQREQFAEAFTGSGLAAIEQKKQTGYDPTHTLEAERKRGATIAERKQASADWEAHYGKLTDLSAFKREILPLIEHVPLSRLVKATGLSLRYVSQIRRGEKIPHPLHWDNLAAAPHHQYEPARGGPGRRTS